jgi:transcriptional regulator with XRE-family HTH domain
MSIRSDEVGERLRAYRLGKRLSADQIAKRIGVSRAAVYRLEKGEIVKIQALQALSELLDVSLPSLLGVGVEYYANAIAFFERMRQLEDHANHIMGNFSPVSWLVLSDHYIDFLRSMLMEASPDGEGSQERQDLINTVLELLGMRRAGARSRRVPIVSLVGEQDLERILQLGLIGRFDLPQSELRKRRAAARFEVEHIRDVMLNQPIGVQIGVVEGQPPTQTFQIYDQGDKSTVTLSPYRLGDQPNISSGIALVTSAPEAVALFKETFQRDWQRAKKGQDGAAVLQRLLDRTAAG